MSVERGPLSETSVTNGALMGSLFLMDSGNMLRQMQLKMEAEAARRARVGPRSLMHGSAMLQYCRPLRKGLATSLAGKVASLEVDGPEVAILGADVAERSRALLTLEGLELLVDGADVESEVAASGEGRAAGGARVRLGGLVDGRAGAVARGRGRRNGERGVREVGHGGRGDGRVGVVVRGVRLREGGVSLQRRGVRLGRGVEPEHGVPEGARSLLQRRDWRGERVEGALRRVRGCDGGGHGAGVVSGGSGGGCGGGVWRMRSVIGE